MSTDPITTESSYRICDLNDDLRRRMHNGTWLLIQGVRTLPELTLLAAVQAVQSFDSFTPDNDPYGEHDFGAAEVEGERIFWKIDAYDKTLCYQSPDPTDIAVTWRVLTLMLASEY